MAHIALPSLTDRFSMALDGLCQAVAARIAGGGMQAAVIMLVWNRLRRIEARVLRLIKAIGEGRVPVGRVPRERARDVPVARVARPPSLWMPRRFGWLIQMVPYRAAGFASQLSHLLAEPEMVNLLATSPRLGQMLRPLCRMLAMDVALLTPVAAAAMAVADQSGVAVDRSAVWPVNDGGWTAGSAGDAGGPQTRAEKFGPV